ncbi:MAG TPA: copper amine oxidase N-terminal domain-containing protein, partial [Symbiobacteriaceae bacterium]|nr:copper amine oxidase N-terminal domain-containing protein [Symbiobacteriaceae bacterium]
MHRRRLVLVLLAIMALLVSLVPAAAAADPLRMEDLPRVAVEIDGQQLQADAFIIDGRTVVPLRAIFERFNVKPEWDGATRTVTAVQGSKVIKLTIDKTEAYVGDTVVTLAVPALIINGSTFVPLRFVSESLGVDPNNIKFDGATRTVTISTGSGCTTPGGQVHTGTISPQGETWGKCGSPHIVKGDFRVEGPDSPILTIDQGVMVQFEAGAGLTVGKDAPGGLLVKGTAGNKVTLTAAAAGAQPGSWNGIRFYNQTLRDQAVIEGASVQYAGGTGNFTGAIYLEGQDKLVEVVLKDVEIKNSQYAGLNMFGQARLSDRSQNLVITGTKSYGGDGGFPIITDVMGSNKLPNGTYTGNELNAVHLWTDGGWVAVSSNTTWRNIGVPYASSVTVKVEGNASPTLKLEPGVITLWKPDTGLEVGHEGPGTLVADAKSKPDGNGDWTIDKTALDGGLSLATSQVMMPGPICGLCSNNHAIVFGPWSDQTSRGAWNGIRFYDKAGDKSKLIGAVVAYAGKEGNFQGAIYTETNEGRPVKFQLANSMVAGSAGQGVEFFGNTTGFMPGSTGNYFTNNAIPIRLFPESIGTMETGNTISGNDNDWISVWSNGSWEAVTKTATWRNLGVPYYFEIGADISGSQRPVITIEAGT